MKLRIMAVDDESEILELLKSHLEWQGCEVADFTDSREAAKRLGDEKIDGLFVDIKMPHVDGFTLVEMARNSKLNARVPVVMLTGMDDGETMRKGFAAGANFFLGKPFTRDRIYRLLGATRGMMSREKQRYARLPFRSLVDYILDAFPGRSHHTESIDISEGGMMLSPTEGLALGREMTMSFCLPDASRLDSARAKVVREAPSVGVGVMFLSLNQRDAKALEEFVIEQLEG